MKEKIDRESHKPFKIKSLVSIEELELQFQIPAGSLSIVDRYSDMLEEIFLLRNPKYRFNKNYKEDLGKFIKKYLGKKTQDQAGEWFYFPWIKTLIHFLPEKEHQELRTGRNRNLITKEEQEKFYNSTISILGMSVGSHAALTIALTGGAKKMKLADLDVIGGSNLNRIRTGYQNLEIKKVIAVARQIYEINPYSQIEIFPDGVTEANVHNIVKADLIVEEMDSPFFKLKVRELARDAKVPVIMAADHHDSIVVDVERYDKKKLPILHGLFGKTTSKDLLNLPPTEMPKIISKFAGAKFSSLRMLESVVEVGKSLYSWPQLGTAATLCGSVLAQLARRILVGENIPTDRFDVNMQRMFLSENSKDSVKKEKMLKLLGIE